MIELQATADSSQPGAGSGLPRRPSVGAARRRARPVDVDGREHVDLRDDRLVLYGSVTRSAGTFVYRVRATNAGTFQVPPAFAEGMYDRSVDRPQPRPPRWRSVKP